MLFREWRVKLEQLDRIAVHYTVKDDFDMLPVLLYQLGSMKRTPENPYGLGWGVDAVGGYQKLAQQIIDRREQHGAFTAMLHRPFGEVAGGPMDIDAGAEMAYDASMHHVLDDFDEAMQMLNDHDPDAEIICYVGAWDRDLADRLDNNYLYAIHHRLGMSLRRLLDHPNVSIAFDAVSGWADDSIMAGYVRFVAGLKATQGRRVIVEAIPPKYTWGRHYDATALDRFVDKHPEKLPLDEGRELIRLRPHSARTLEDFMAACETDGHTPALPVWEWDEWVEPDAD